MQLFVGLGNPGAGYAGHRHNVGFMAVDRIAERAGIGPWRTKFGGALAEGRLGDHKVLLLKPMTFMNRSGQSVGEAARFGKIAPEAVTVFHDELDLAPGRMRVKRGGGHAGHNGLRSLHEHLGAEYRRVRIGIGHPGHKDRVAGYVLHDFAKADAGWLEPLLDALADEAGWLAAGDDAGFATAVAQRLQPPKPRVGGAAPEARREAGKGGGRAARPETGAPLTPGAEPERKGAEPGRKGAEPGLHPDRGAAGAPEAGSGVEPPGRPAATWQEQEAAANRRSALARLIDRFR